MSDHAADQPAAGGEEPLRLALHICFALQNTSRAFNAVYRTVLRETGLTYPQYLVMLALWEHGDLTVKGLGALLRLDSGTLSPLLKRLEAAGLITRSRSLADERSVLIGLSEAGEALREPARKVPAEIQAAAGLSADDLRTLDRILRQLTDSLDHAATSEH
ncbi:MarR family winged helix-turn-helix transcriptional regulator [Actinacidiphila rubida]|uniref:DNA-binding transcriptional regulator, MarR family n=1 Tax=Actinacidiphila rubida TaxID=310780 RepID=A0A1H8EB98_9ACTN|nr:MarR family transcriptional regulator [Actinacidiphila rubida]SEN16745.1 DNA-binding transcriptional regulator, MarR family [Actinacidiphila rubida]